MQIYNALDIKSGKKSEYNKMGTLTQPIQFLPKDKKDQEWAAWNLDWLELQGQKQLRRNARRLMKNYKLAKGLIDKTDYIVEEDNDYTDLVDILTKQDESALELKFYPIIPNVINVLVSEFSKRASKVAYRAVDEMSYNDMLEQKRANVEEVLLQEAQDKVMASLIEAGMDIESEEVKQQLSPESLKTLPEIEQFFKKDYRSVIEQWAWHQHQVDEERFKIQELEELAFRDLLIADREFWHFKMMDDDYDVELWNPLMTFYHKSPDTRYISQSNWVGKCDMMTISDVVDKFGFLMTQEQIESIEVLYPVRSSAYPITGMQNDGSYYDNTRSHDWNTNQPSLAYRQFVSMTDNYINDGNDIVNMILSDSEDLFDMGSAHYLRVTTCYWKSQRKVGHLTKVDINGQIVEDIIDESYKVTMKPEYDNLLFKNKTKENLIYGEHIDWIWINETWGGIKIGPNRPSYWGMNNPDGLTPIYLGITKNQISKLPFQFKGDNSLYGCKLPVEGAVFSDRNTKSVSLVDLMKPYQIAYNIVNNQIADILVDELGTVIMLDQNSLPRHSLGEDWGKHNLAKAYVAMKTFQMLPLDTSITNTENALNFQHYQVLNLEQTQRLLSRIQLAQYFKTQAFESIGITPQRMGSAVEQPTAEGVRVAVSNSYAQTETYFTQHCDNLMPRVHNMRTDLAQYYHSNRPSTRLQYLTSHDEKVTFTVDGTDLLMRDLNIFCTTKANHRNILEQLKQLALNNNTSGASIYDLSNIIKSQSIPEVDIALKTAEEKQDRIRKEQGQEQQKMQEQQLQAMAAEKQAERDFQMQEKDKDRQTDILEAQIKSSGYGAMQDINENKESDYMDAMREIRASDEYQQTMSFNNQKENNKMSALKAKDDLKREDNAIKRDIANKQLEIARINKNKYDMKQTLKSKEKKKNK
jgi:hypothetical protein